MKEKLIDLFSLEEYQKPMINVIEVLLSGSAVMTTSCYDQRDDVEGSGSGYDAKGGFDLY